MRYWFFAFLLAALLCFGQMKMTVAQLKAMIESSKQLGHSDKKVAEYVKTIKLTERLDEQTVEEMQDAGAGPKTVEALKALSTTSAELPVAAPPVPKAVPKPIPPPETAEQTRVLEEARQYAEEYTKKLPNFICTEVTRRYVDPSGMEFWTLADTVVSKLTYFENHEDYKVILVNNRVTDTTMEKLGGATSTGEFGSMMKEIFAPSTETHFAWERWGTLRGHRMHVYSYQVDQPKSQWHVVYEKSFDVVPGYKGLIYVDHDTSAIMRITLEAVNLPPAFPIQQAGSVLDYDLTEIAGSQYVVPIKSVMRLRTGRSLSKNDIEFRFYKKFGAEATIKIGDPLAEDKEQPPK
jgi:hypothetical protein